MPGEASDDEAEVVAKELRITNIKMAETRLGDFSTTMAFYNKGMVNSAIRRVWANLHHAITPCDNGVINTLAADINDRLHHEKGRAEFIVDCRKQVSAELGEQKLSAKMEDPIVKRIVEIIGEEKEGYADLDFGSYEVMKIVIGERARIASYIFALENLERMEEEMAIYGSVMIEDVFGKIRDHLDYAWSDCPDSNTPIIFHDKKIDDQVNAAECRAIFIVTCGELTSSGDVSWLGGNKMEAMKTAEVLWEYLERYEYPKHPADPSEYTPECVIDLIDKMDSNRLLSMAPAAEPA